MVRIHPDPPGTGIGDLRSRGSARSHRGAVAQLGERLLCKQEVVGSIPSSSTSFRYQASGIRHRQTMRGAERDAKRSDASGEDAADVWRFWPVESVAL